MANMLDYLAMRGDLTFQKDPFNDVDNLLCAELPFLDLSGIVPDSAGKETDLQAAIASYFERNKADSLGMIVPNEIFDAARAMGKAPRFEKTRLTAYRYVLKEKGDEKAQWAAVTFLFEDRSMYVSFAGTDDTLVSWKENFDMALTDCVPSQREAAEYLEEVILSYPSYLVSVGGHSKGGNLAVYAAAKCAEDLQKKIFVVYDNDGPGFRAGFLSCEGYKRVKSRIRNILPEQSFIGLLFERDLEPIVVKSSYKGIMQHDSFSWQVKGNTLETLPGLGEKALSRHRTVEKWYNDMTEEEKKAFVEILYRILTGTNSKTLTELSENKAGLLRSYRALSKEERASLHGVLKKLYKAGKEVRAAVSAEKNAKEKTVKRI